MDKPLELPPFAQVGAVNPDPLVSASILINLVQSKIIFFCLWQAPSESIHVGVYLRSRLLNSAVCNSSGGKPSGFDFVIVSPGCAEK